MQRRIASDFEVLPVFRRVLDNTSYMQTIFVCKSVSDAFAIKLKAIKASGTPRAQGGLPKGPGPKHKKRVNAMHALQ